MNIALILRTVSHLRFRQVVYQVWNRVARHRYRELALPGKLVQRGVRPLGVMPCVKPESWLGNNRFSFLNIDAEPAGWNDTTHGMLWAYNLNYMDWLMQPGVTAQQGAEWIERFLADMTDRRVGLDPYPIALRCINWVKFLSRHAAEFSTDDLSRWHSALYSQAALLERKLEYHLLGNHLLEDYYALYIVAAYLNDNRRLARAHRRVLRELREQILPDGAHYEQSPMYHCILLDRLLDCINAAPSAELIRVAERMLGHTEAIAWADGSLPMFNDAAEGIAPTVAQLRQYASALGLHWQPIPLKECGYRRMSCGKFEAVVDIGEITATYQPGHTHADALSFELRVDGQPVVVDTGISTYNKTERRQYERSTAAHNTVCVDGRDSAEVWGGFRVGRRYGVTMLEDTPCKISARLSTGHCRTFILTENSLQITDCISQTTVGIAYLHFAPNTSVTQRGMQLLLPIAQLDVSGAEELKLMSDDVSTEYNNVQITHRAEIKFAGTIHINITDKR